MGVKTLLFGVDLARFRAQVGGGDRAAADRLEAIWFGEKAIAEEEKKPDRTLLQGLLLEGELYEALDDETSLRLDKMVMILMERELGLQPLAFSAMRDDMQLLVRAVKGAGKPGGDLLDHLANGRRFGTADAPIDVPHYAWLDAAEAGRLAGQLQDLGKLAEPRGFLSRLTGGKSPFTPEQVALMASLGAALAELPRRGPDLFSVNRDPEARWDMV